MLDLFRRTKEPEPPTLDEREMAQLAVAQAIERDSADLARLATDKQTTAAAHLMDNSALVSLTSNPRTFPAPEVLAAKQKACDSSEQAATQAAATHAAKTIEYDLPARRAKLRQDERRLLRDRCRAAYEAACAKKVQQVSDLIATENAGEQILTDAFRAFPERVILDDGTVIEKGAGLTDCQFPEGVFGAADPKSHLSGEAQVTRRSIWSDQVALAINLLFPQIPLPPEAASRVSELKSLTAAGAPKPRWWVSAISWNTERARRLGK